MSQIILIAVLTLLSIMLITSTFPWVVECHHLVPDTSIQLLQFHLHFPIDSKVRCSEKCDHKVLPGCWGSPHRFISQSIGERYDFWPLYWVCLKPQIHYNFPISLWVWIPSSTLKEERLVIFNQPVVNFLGPYFNQAIKLSEIFLTL